MMNREHSLERQPTVADQNRHQRSGPVMTMQNLRARAHSPRDFDRGFAEEDEARGVVGIRFAAFLVNAGPIKQLIATYIKDLQTFRGSIFEQIGHESLVA